MRKMKTLTRTREVGGSLIVTIPKEIVKEESLNKDELVEIEVKKLKKSGFGALKGIGKFSDRDREEIWKDRI